MLYIGRRNISNNRTACTVIVLGCVCVVKHSKGVNGLAVDSALVCVRSLTGKARAAAPHTIPLPSVPSAYPIAIAPWMYYSTILYYRYVHTLTVMYSVLLMALGLVIHTFL